MSTGGVLQGPATVFLLVDTFCRNSHPPFMNDVADVAGVRVRHHETARIEFQHHDRGTTRAQGTDPSGRCDVFTVTDFTPLSINEPSAPDRAEEIAETVIGTGHVTIPKHSARTTERHARPMERCGESKHETDRCRRPDYSGQQTRIDLESWDPRPVGILKRNDRTPDECIPAHGEHRTGQQTAPDSG